MKKVALAAMIMLGATTASKAQMMGAGVNEVVAGAVFLGAVVLIATGATTSTNATP